MGKKKRSFVEYNSNIYVHTHTTEQPFGYKIPAVKLRLIKRTVGKQKAEETEMKKRVKCMGSMMVRTGYNG